MTGHASCLERVVRFGQDAQLLGLLTEGAHAPSPGTPGVLLLNAGIIHRIGPHRLNVKLARHTAGLGYPAIRFDLSGLGDSPPSRSSLGFERQAVSDISAAIDCLVERTGCRSVVGVGLCSGADNLFNAALEDKRLGGLLLLDPHAYGSREARVRYLVPRAFDAARWGRFAERTIRMVAGQMKNQGGRLMSLGKMAQDAGEAGITAADDYPEEGGRQAPPRKEFGAKLKSILDRGTSVLLTYTGNTRQLINAAGQFRRTFSDFEFGPGLEVEVLPDVDHTFTRLSSQRRLGERLERLILRVAGTDVADMLGKAGEKTS